MNLWVPCYVNSSADGDVYKLGPLARGTECPMSPIPLTKCGGKSDCPLDEFVSIITEQILSTGDWASLCSFKSSSDLVQQLYDANMTQQHLHTAVSLFSIAFCVAIIIAATLLAVVMCRNRMKANDNNNSINNNYVDNNGLVSGYSDYEDVVSYQRSNSMGGERRPLSSRSNVNENSSLLSSRSTLIEKANGTGYRSEDSLP